MSKLFTASRPTSFRQYIGRVAKFYAFVIVGRFIGVQLGNYVYNRLVAKAAHPSALFTSPTQVVPWGYAPLATPPYTVVNAMPCCQCKGCQGSYCPSGCVPADGCNNCCACCNHA